MLARDPALDLAQLVGISQLRSSRANAMTIVKVAMPCLSEFCLPSGKEPAPGEFEGLERGQSRSSRAESPETVSNIARASASLKRDHRISS